MAPHQQPTAGVVDLMEAFEHAGIEPASCVAADGVVPSVMYGPNYAPTTARNPGNSRDTW
jgi:hypothetical protein